MSNPVEATATQPAARETSRMNRRTAIVAGGVALAGAVVLNRYTDLFASPIYRTIRPTAHWAAPDFTAFLEKMNAPQQAAVMDSLDMKGSAFGVATVKEKVLWYASNAVEYYFLDKENYNYHDLRLRRFDGERIGHLN